MFWLLATTKFATCEVLQITGSWAVRFFGYEFYSITWDIQEELRISRTKTEGLLIVCFEINSSSFWWIEIKKKENYFVIIFNWKNHSLYHFLINSWIFSNVKSVIIWLWIIQTISTSSVLECDRCIHEYLSVANSLLLFSEMKCLVCYFIPSLKRINEKCCIQKKTRNIVFPNNCHESEEC